MFAAQPGTLILAEDTNEWVEVADVVAWQDTTPMVLGDHTLVPAASYMDAMYPGLKWQVVYEAAGNPMEDVVTVLQEVHLALRDIRNNLPN